jgi:hypothetical protein
VGYVVKAFPRCMGELFHLGQQRLLLLTWKLRWTNIRADCPRGILLCFAFLAVSLSVVSQESSACLSVPFLCLLIFPVLWHVPFAELKWS